jgi:hypothetical protein
MMREAFAAAGFQTPVQRLHACILAALANPTDKPSQEPERDPVAAARLHEVAMQAVKQSLRNWDGARDALIKAVRADASLMWELFAPYRNQALQAALTAAATELRRQETPRREPGHRGAGPPASDNPMNTARPAPISTAAICAVSGAAAATLLDTFRVNGQPIGDLTVREATAWAGKRARDARFVRLLTDNLPAGDVIRKWRTGDDAARMYAIAEDMSDAA